MVGPCGRADAAGDRPGKRKQGLQGADVFFFLGGGDVERGVRVRGCFSKGSLGVSQHAWLPGAYRMNTVDGRNPFRIT